MIKTHLQTILYSPIELKLNEKGDLCAPYVWKSSPPYTRIQFNYNHNIMGYSKLPTVSNKILKQSLEEINLQNHIIQSKIPSTTETTKQHISKATLMCDDVSVLMMSWFLFQRSANVSLTSFL